MLNIDVRKNAASAKAYYRDPEYYRDGPALAAPEWGGQGAHLLGLTRGHAEREHAPPGRDAARAAAADARKAVRLTRMRDKYPNLYMPAEYRWLESYERKQAESAKAVLPEPQRDAGFMAGFNRLMDNKHPVTGQQLTPRQKDNRRCAYDVSFHPPKSVSLALELGKDGRVLDAFQRAVRDTMKEVESHAAVRVRKAGKSTDAATGVMAWATFWHGLARPVNGFPSPHLHAHCVVANATWHADEAWWKAVQMGPVKSAAPDLQASFHRNLRTNLHALGYQTRRHGRSWELMGVPQTAVAKFSERHGVIQTVFDKMVALASLGGQPPTPKRWLGVKTREPKRDDYTRQHLQTAWVSRLTEKEEQAFARLAPATHADPVRSRTREWVASLCKIGQRVVDQQRQMSRQHEHGMHR